jgi:hypothetical protein
VFRTDSFDDCWKLAAVKDEVVEVSIEEPDTDVDDDEDLRSGVFLQMYQLLQQVCVLQSYSACNTKRFTVGHGNWSFLFSVGPFKPDLCMDSVTTASPPTLVSDCYQTNLSLRT